MSNAMLHASKEKLKNAVHQNKVSTRAGLTERLFTWMFKGLVYPQIWEDPGVDMGALRLTQNCRMVTIASGGCNMLSYLTADPKQITAIDLNRAHIALARLKCVAARELPTYDLFFRFFGEADQKANKQTYARFLRDRLDADTRSYWDGRDLTGQRRISLFWRDLYRHGLLGYFVGTSHFLARLYGVDLREFTWAKSLDEQRTFFDKRIAPLFEKRLLRWVTSKKMSLYGLGIPPAQYDSLVLSSDDGSMATVLRQRLERLACGFPIAENYFAWQAFGRGYPPEGPGGESGPLPPYLERDHFETIKCRVDRVSVKHRGYTEHLATVADDSLDAYVLLDAQDWMTDAQLNALWSGIARTARPGARVIFRTAHEPTLLPGRVDPAILDRWDYRAEDSLAWTARDRSAIYGGFHLYVFKG